jgi:hypothetical protein
MLVAMPLRLALSLCLCLAASCSSRVVPDDGEMSAAACSNGRDDDGDGFVDCADLACTVHAWCMGGDIDAGHMVDTGPMPRDFGPTTCDEPLDVVFVLDVSTSMADEAMRMRDGIASIWDAAHLLTTNTQFGLVVFVDDALAVGGCAPFADVGTLQSEFDRWRMFCESNLSPVSMSTMNGDCPENSLDAIHLAATTCPWRAGATHVLVHVTDDTFAERPAVLSRSLFGGGGIPVQHTYAEVVSALVANEIRVGAFAAPTGEWCGAGTSPNTAQGFFAPYMGMEALPMRTGGRVWSIREVRDGTINMAAAINELIADEYCTPFII